MIVLCSVCIPPNETHSHLWECSLHEHRCHCGCATKRQLHEQRHRGLLGLFTPWCSRLLLLRVFKDQCWPWGSGLGSCAASATGCSNGGFFPGASALHGGLFAKGFSALFAPLFHLFPASYCLSLQLCHVCKSSGRVVLGAQELSKVYGSRQGT